MTIHLHTLFSMCSKILEAVKLMIVHAAEFVLLGSFLWQDKQSFFLGRGFQKVFFPGFFVYSLKFYILWLLITKFLSKCALFRTLLSFSTKITSLDMKTNISLIINDD